LSGDGRRRSFDDGDDGLMEREEMEKRREREKEVCVCEMDGWRRERASQRASVGRNEP